MASSRTSYRSRNYGYKWHLRAEDGTPDVDLGWFFQVGRAGTRMIRLLPVDLGHYNRERAKRGKSQVDPEWTAKLALKRVVDKTPTGMAGVGKSRLIHIAGEGGVSAVGSLSAGPKVQGDATAALAGDLAHLINEMGLQGKYQVICSHRGKYESAAKVGKSPPTFRHIGQFIGSPDIHQHSNRFGIADIVIATRGESGGRVVVLIEVEENPQGVVPKVDVADASTPMLMDRIDIWDEGLKPRCLNLDDAEIWVAHFPRRGDDRSRTSALEKRLNELLQAWRQWRIGRGIPPGPSKTRFFNMPRGELFTTLVNEVGSLMNQEQRFLSESP